MEGRNLALEAAQRTLPLGVVHRTSPMLRLINRARPVHDIGNWFRRNAAILALLSAGAAVGGAYAWRQQNQTPEAVQASPTPTINDRDGLPRSALFLDDETPHERE